MTRTPDPKHDVCSCSAGKCPSLHALCRLISGHLCPLGQPWTHVVVCTPAHPGRAARACVCTRAKLRKIPNPLSCAVLFVMGTTVGLVGDIARSLGSALVPFCDDFMDALLATFQDPGVEHVIETPTLCFSANWAKTLSFSRRACACAGVHVCARARSRSAALPECWRLGCVSWPSCCKGVCAEASGWPGNRI